MTFPYQLKTKTHQTQLYLRDLAYLNFSLSFFKTVMQDIKEKQDNKNKTINQRLYRRLEKIVNKIGYSVAILNDSDLNRMNTMYKKLFKKLLTMGKTNTVEINMELLATYILYCRFREKRVNTLHKNFEYFADLKVIFNTADFICQIDNIDVESELVEYKLAFQLAKVL